MQIFSSTRMSTSKRGLQRCKTNKNQQEKEAEVASDKTVESKFCLTFDSKGDKTYLQRTSL